MVGFYLPSMLMSFPGGRGSLYELPFDDDDAIYVVQGARPFPLGLIFPRPTFFFLTKRLLNNGWGEMKPS